jgi:diguanylate cyclase (GGDEF)-like protein
MQVRRTVGIVVVALLMLIAGTFAAVKFTTDHLLYQHATSAAQHWARYIADNVTDLEYIATGEQPSSASMEFFQWAQRIGLVYRYEIFNRQGFSQLVSDRERTSLVDVSEFSPNAARSAVGRKPIVAVVESDGQNQPSYLAQSYVPVVVEGQPIAVVAAFVDQTDERDAFFQTFLVAAFGLCLMTGLAFTLPAAAWYRRTKEKERADEQIRYLAHHDSMTGLDNRFRLTEKLQRSLIALPDRGGKLALHYVDLDRFKDVNDTLGHDAGDNLIQAVAERLRTVARKKDIVARIGGDEFTIVQVDATDKAEAEALAQRVIGTLQQPFVINGQTVSVGASVGVAMAPGDGIDVAQLMRCADLALYKAKADGRNCARFFTPQLGIANQARLTLELALRAAVANDGFDLHFQPVYESANNALVGFEALIRLPPFNGDDMISPSVFIPVAEEFGLIGYIGDWVLRKACRIAAAWPEHLTVSINMSPAQFTCGNIHKSVDEALRESGLAAHRLEIEITEGLLLGDTEAVLEQLRELKRLGVSIVMDDFGTGYSSLNYLWRFHFDKIKIDKSFISAYGSVDGNAETVIKTIVALGRSLNVQVTVEGVETDRQARFVSDLRADQVQGFYFGRPMPASEIGAEILQNFQRTDGVARDRAAEKPAVRRSS